MSSPAPSRPRIDPRHLLLVIVVVGAALRCFAIGRQSFWCDETVSSILAGRPLAGIVLGLSRDLGNPPFHLVALHLWGALFGTSDAALRSLSALAGVLSIPLTYSVGRRLLGQATALGGAAILAVAPVHVYFGQEARTYTLVGMLCLLSLDMLLRAVEASELAGPAGAGSPKRAWWVWPVHALATFCAIYAHYYAFFVVLAQFIWVLWDHRRDRGLLARFFASLGVAALLFTTWLPSFYAQVTTKGNLARAAESWHLHMISTPMVFGVGTTLAWKDTATPLRLAAALIATLALAIPGVIGAWRLRESGRSALRLLLLWLFLPIVLPLLVSALLFPFYYVRYSLLASPAYYLLVAAGLARLARPVRAGFIAAMAVPAAASLFTYYTTLVKHDFRAATAYVESRAASGDVVCFDADITETPYSRYARSDRPRLRLMVAAPDLPQDRFYGTNTELGVPGDITVAVERGERVWLVRSDLHLGSGEGYRKMFDAGWRFVDDAHFRGIDVRLYERTRPPPPTP